MPAPVSTPTTNSNLRLILASSSPYRRSLLGRLGLAFDAASPDIDETPLPEELPETLARRLSAEKALKFSCSDSAALVIGSDQVASLDHVLLGKPGSEPRAIAQLRYCSGRRVDFFTAVSLARHAAILEQACVHTAVHFRQLEEDEILYYVKKERPFDCAGSFRWEGLGIALFKGLESDDPTALEGLPLITTSQMLTRQGVNPLQPTA